MAQEQKSVPAQGPYRTPPPPRMLVQTRWAWVAATCGLPAIAAIAVLSGPTGEARARPTLADVPRELLHNVSEWPGPEADMRIATPLAPLLSADQPEDLSVLSPGEGAMRLTRGQSITV